MESIPVACEPFLFPKPKASNFQFPRAGHIHEMPHVFSHSPAMHQAVGSILFFLIFDSLFFSLDLDDFVQHCIKHLQCYENKNTE